MALQADAVVNGQYRAPGIEEEGEEVNVTRDMVDVTLVVAGADGIVETPQDSAREKTAEAAPHLDVRRKGGRDVFVEPFDAVEAGDGVAQVVGDLDQWSLFTH